MFSINPKTEKEKKLVDLASKVPDTYHDFVLGLLLGCRATETVDKMVGFMEENSEASSSVVLEYQTMLEDEDDHIREDLGLPPRWEEQ